MLKQNIGVRTVSVAIVTVMLLAGASLLFSGNVKAWVNISLSPTTVTAGTNIDFYVTLFNPDNYSVNITYVGLHFDWMSAGTNDYNSSGVSYDNPYLLTSGESATFYIYNVPIPTDIATNTSHLAKLTIYETELVGSIPDYMTITQNDSIYVKSQEPTYTVSGYVTDANTGDGIASVQICMGNYFTETNREGFYSINGVTPGLYRIFIRSIPSLNYGGTLPSKWITVDGDMEVDFQLSPQSSSGGGSNGGSGGGTNSGGGNNGGSSGTTNGPGSSGGNSDALYMVALIGILAIVAIIAMIVVAARKKREKMPPPPMAKYE